MARAIPLEAIADMAAQEIGVSGWHEITQREIDAFAAVTGDHQWMHVDVPRATREMGGTIAHGLLTLSLLPALSEEIYHVTGYAGGFSYGYDKVRFTKPVKCGSRVRLRLALTEVGRKGAGIMVVTRCTIEVEGEEAPALVADWRSLYFAPGGSAGLRHP